MCSVESPNAAHVMEQLSARYVSVRRAGSQDSEQT